MSENGTTHDMVPMTDFLQVCSQIVQRLTLRHGVTFQGARDMYTTLGYQHTLEYRDYYARYRRGGIAQALINAFTRDTWRLPPIIREVDKPDETADTPFEKSWTELVKRLKLGRVLERVDRLAAIGHYAVLVLTLRGQPDFSIEAGVVRGPEDLIHVQVYSEEHATVLALVDEDVALFGQPRLYNIDFSRRQAEYMVSQQIIRPALGGKYGQLVPVHASRVIHVAEDGLEDDVIGTPALQAVWNYLDDLDKMVGGAAEMYWQDAKQRIVAALREGAVLNDEDAAALEGHIQEFIHGLRNILKVQGIDITQLRGGAVDASPNIDKVVELIAGTKRIPKRRLLGSERGELASSQDEGNFATVIASRQMQHVEPIILRPLIDRLIALRVLPAPSKGYEVEWQPLLIETEQEKANTALAWSRAFKEYAGQLGSPEDILPLEIYLSDIVGWDTEQVERIMDLIGKQEAARLRERPVPGPVPRQDAEDDAETDDADAAA